jgi:hypothetical protein
VFGQKAKASKIMDSLTFLQNGKDNVKIVFISIHHFATRNSLVLNSSTKEY